MKFGIFKRAGVSPRSRPAVRKAVANVDRSLAEWDKRVDTMLKDARLSKRSKRFIKDQWYGDPRGQPLALGNRAVHQASMFASIITLLVHSQEDPKARKGRKRLRMLSSSPDCGLTPFEAPQINFAALGRHFDQAARDAHVNAFGFLDLAIVKDRRDPRSTTIAFHMHAAIRAKANEFRTKSAQQAASPSRRPQALAQELEISDTPPAEEQRSGPGA